MLGTVCDKSHQKRVMRQMAVMAGAGIHYTHSYELNLEEMMETTA